MEQRIRPNTTLTIVQRQDEGQGQGQGQGHLQRQSGQCQSAVRVFGGGGSVGRPRSVGLSFAKRSGVGFVVVPTFQSPTAISSTRVRVAPMPMQTATPSLTTTTKVMNDIPELESMYLVTIFKAENVIRITLTPGKEDGHTSKTSKAIIDILEEKGFYNKTMKAHVIKTGSKEAYDRMVVGGVPFSWTHPKSNMKTTFLVKKVEGAVLSRLGGAGGVVGKGGGDAKGVAAVGSRVGVVAKPGGSTSTLLSKPLVQNLQQAPRGRGRPPKALVLSSRGVIMQSQPARPTVSRGRGGGGRGGILIPKLKPEVIDLDSDSESDADYEEEDDDDEEEDEPLFVKKPERCPVPTAATVAQGIKAQVKSNSNVGNSTVNAGGKPESLQLDNIQVSSAKSGGGGDDGLQVTVVRGNIVGLPTKTIIPPSKLVSCHYKVPDVKKFTQKYSKTGLTFNLHPFLGDRFMIVSCNSVVQKSTKTKKSEAPLPLTRNKRKLTEDPVINLPAKRLRNVSSTSSMNKGRQPPPATKNALVTTTRNNSTISKPPPVRKVVKEMSFSPSEDSSASGSSDSDSSSSGSGSDSEFSVSEEDAPGVGRRTSQRGPVIENKNKKTLKDKDDYDRNHDIFKPAPRYFVEAKPCRPIRKSPEGRIYFSLKAKLAPSEYHKNEDLFINWEKFVRAESPVGAYYKTMLMRTLQFVFVIYHLERQQEKLVLDRSVEMLTDGTIKIRLKGEDVTLEFMQYVNIDNNTHLNCLLTNLINSNLCPGCPEFALISIYPEAILRDDIWYSKKCSRVVFHDVQRFTTSPNATHNFYTSNIPCQACTELRSRLQAESIQVIKERHKFKKIESPKQNKRGRAKGVNNPIVYGKYTPPEPVEKAMQVRKALSDLFLDFWKDMGFKDVEFPKQTSDLDVNVVTEKDFPIPEIKEDPNEIQGLLPALPESIPILENIDFDEDGQTMLTFSEVPLNPYDMANIHFMNSSMDMPHISDEMIDSLMNTSDPDILVQTLAGIPNPGKSYGDTDGGRGHVAEVDLMNSVPPSNNEFHENPHHQYPDQYSFNVPGLHENHHHLSHITNPNLNSHSTSYSSGMEPHNIIDFENNIDFNLTDSSLIFPTFSLTEL